MEAKLTLLLVLPFNIFKILEVIFVVASVDCARSSERGYFHEIGGLEVGASVTYNKEFAVYSPTRYPQRNLYHTIRMS